jgi:DNA-binding NarL/FixJ family response regulator
MNQYRSKEFVMKIFVADGQDCVRHALRVLLERQPGSNVIGEASAGDLLVEELNRCQPQILILDPDLPRFELGPGIRTLRSRHPRLILIVLSGRDEHRGPALLAGADLFIDKNKPPDELLAALQRFASDPSIASAA